jgi:SAM-dependent methyltransferase
LRAAFPDYSYTDGAMHSWRFNLFERLVAKHGLPQGARMLNVGCGPFALEALSPTARRCKVTSFDYTPEFTPVYERLMAEKLLGDVTFFVGDIREVTFDEASFDIAVFHDVFYEAALSAPEVIARYVPFVKPGGLIYFDIMDKRAEGLWRLMGSEREEYRRYDVDAALRRIEKAGLERLEQCPTNENRIGAKRITLNAIRLLTGKVNSYGILARRKA